MSCTYNICIFTAQNKRISWVGEDHKDPAPGHTKRINWKKNILKKWNHYGADLPIFSYSACHINRDCRIWEIEKKEITWWRPGEWGKAGRAQKHMVRSIRVYAIYHFVCRSFGTDFVGVYLVRLCVPGVVQQSLAAASVIQQVMFTPALLRPVCKMVVAGAGGDAWSCALGSSEEGIAHRDWGEALGSDRQKTMTVWRLLFWYEVLCVCAPSFEVSGGHTLIQDVFAVCVHDAIKSGDDVVYFRSLFCRISVSASIFLIGFLVLFLLFAGEDVVQHTESSFFL